jgi:hypothetical protein
MEATAVLIADAGSNAQMQPSQLQLYLLKRVMQQQKWSYGLQDVTHKHALDTRL